MNYSFDSIVINIIYDCYLLTLNICIHYIVVAVGTPSIIMRTLYIIIIRPLASYLRVDILDKQQGYIIIIILFYKSCVAAQESCTVREKEIDRQRRRKRERGIVRSRKEHGIRKGKRWM